MKEVVDSKALPTDAKERGEALGKAQKESGAEGVVKKRAKVAGDRRDDCL